MGSFLHALLSHLNSLPSRSRSEDWAHPRPDGGVYVLDSRKAPYWTIPSGLRFVAGARASRKTVLFGTISDYSEACGARYRRVARDALQVADRVLFIGPNPGPPQSCGAAP